MTDLTPRQREILSMLVSVEMLRGCVKIEQAADDAALMGLRIYEDIGLDSLEVVELGMEMEAAFGLDEAGIPDDDIGALETLGDAVRLVERMMP